MRIFLLTFLLTSSLFAADLKILSWNTFMLPWPIKMSNQEIRTEIMIKALLEHEYDFVFMQEAFTETFRSRVGSALKKRFRYQYYLGSDGFFPFFGSGLFVLSKHPFKILEKIYFKDCANADCMAAKGSVLIESHLVSGRVVQFANTHLQADQDLGVIRTSQFRQIQEMLSRYRREGISQLLVGDLNTSSEETDFQDGATLLKMKPIELTGPFGHTNVIECYHKPDHPKRWIDHIWIDLGTRIKTGSLQVRDINYTYEGKTCVASDHHAVEGIFTFEK